MPAILEIETARILPLASTTVNSQFGTSISQIVSVEPRPYQPIESSVIYITHGQNLSRLRGLQHEKAERLDAMLQRWCAQPSTDEDRRWEDLKAGLEANRLSSRQLYRD